MFGRKRTKPTHNRPDLEILTCQFEITPSDVDAERLLLVPAGQVKSTSGDFVMDAAGAGLVIKAFRDHGVDLVIDYDHQTLGGSYASPNGQAPAAGWIKALSFDGRQGLRGDVTWTPDGLHNIDSRSYKYISPVVCVRKSDRRVVGLHSAALTNKPAIAAMTPIAASESVDQFLLSLADPPEGGEEAEPVTGEFTETIDTMDADKLQAFVSRIVAELGLADDATGDDLLTALNTIIGAATEASTDRGRAGHQQNLVALREELRREMRVDHAIQQNVILAKHRTMALSLLTKDEALYEEFVNSSAAKARPPAGRTTPPHPGDTLVDRDKVVREAQREYRTDPDLRRVTTEDAVINLALRENGYEPIITPLGSTNNAPARFRPSSRTPATEF